MSETSYDVEKHGGKEEVHEAPTGVTLSALGLEGDHQVCYLMSLPQYCFLTRLLLSGQASATESPYLVSRGRTKSKKRKKEEEGS